MLKRKTEGSQEGSQSGQTRRGQRDNSGPQPPQGQLGKGAPADPATGGPGYMIPGQMGKGTPAGGSAASAHNQGP
eukprot:12829172-Heterocapsa_arctica.AAC.1